MSGGINMVNHCSPCNSNGSHIPREVEVTRGWHVKNNKLKLTKNAVENIVDRYCPDSCDSNNKCIPREVTIPRGWKVKNNRAVLTRSAVENLCSNRCSGDYDTSNNSSKYPYYKYPRYPIGFGIG
jgi:hypothetical protein